MVSSFHYTVNDIGQRTAVVPAPVPESDPAVMPVHQVAWAWDYNSRGELVSADHGADQTANTHDRFYEYDDIGNRDYVRNSTYVDDGGVTPENYTANALNQYTGAAQGFTHDDDGNLTAGDFPGGNGNNPGVQTPVGATNITWDAENRLTSCTISSVTQSFAYDHMSRLVTWKVGTNTVRHYHYDGWNRIAEYFSEEPLDTFTWGLDLSGGLQGAGGVGGLLATRWFSTGGFTDYFPTYDGNGNVSEYLGSGGETAVHYEYDPFRTLTQRTGSADWRFQYRFSTKPRHPVTGLYYYGYRHYDPVTGRWPSRDPIGEAGGVNLYGFVGNDGVNQWDYLGLTVALHDNPGTGSQGPDPEMSKASLDLAKKIEETYKDDERVHVDIWVGTRKSHSHGDIVAKVRTAVGEGYDKVFVLIGAHGQVRGTSGPADLNEVIGEERWKDHFIALSTDVDTFSLEMEIKRLDPRKTFVDIWACFYKPHYRSNSGNRAPVRVPYGILPRDYNVDESQKLFMTLSLGGNYGHWKNILETNLDELRDSSCPKIAVLMFDGRHATARSD